MGNWNKVKVMPEEDREGETRPRKHIFKLLVKIGWDPAPNPPLKDCLNNTWTMWPLQWPGPFLLCYRLNFLSWKKEPHWPLWRGKSLLKECTEKLRIVSPFFLGFFLPASMHVSSPREPWSSKHTLLECGSQGSKAKLLYKKWTKNAREPLQQHLVGRHLGLYLSTPNQPASDLVDVSGEKALYTVFTQSFKILLMTLL